MPFRPQPPGTPANKKGRTPPPEETFEESAYLRMLGEKQKQVSIKLLDGEIVTGWIEYYDRGMIRLTRENAPNLFIFKHEIMYIADGPLQSGARKRQPRAASEAPKEP
jgi:host factor-I protein